MKPSAILLPFLFAVGSAQADILVPAHTIRAKQVIAATDLVVKTVDIPGAISDPSVIIGQEAQKALFPNRPIRGSDIGPPALVERNQLVKMVFRNGGLQIIADGRSMGRGAIGDTVRVLNIASRTTLSGRVRTDGKIEVKLNE
jgi:flagellar basal body P-ring formation protein FlgA